MRTRIYIDTNVILARYAPHEPQHHESKKLLDNIEKGELAAVTSVLALVEVVSVTGRAYDRFAGKGESLGREEVTGVFLRRITSIRNLEFIPVGGEVSLDLERGSLKLPVLFAVALEIGSRVGVKTLDNLHLAAASIASRIYDHRIDYFVTLDDDMLRRHEKIEDSVHAKVVTPAEILSHQREH